jgi:hypothetical protein
MGKLDSTAVQPPTSARVTSASECDAPSAPSAADSFSRKSSRSFFSLPLLPAASAVAAPRGLPFAAT